MPESATILERDQTLAPPPALDSARTALFLDLDGTLAAIETRPRDVGPVSERTELLKTATRRLNGRLAVISGRALSDIDHILQGSVTAAAAVHGLVRRNAAGAVLSRPPHPALNTARVALDWLEDQPGVLIEDKRLSIAVHYRRAPELADEVLAACRKVAAGTGLVVQLGRMVVELRTPGADKGDSVRAFMAEAPFAGATPVFVGDDVTDEDGFSAAADLGGYGVLVGEPRETAARYRLEDVDAVLGWLAGAP
ncbi:MAG TPA: trehalose-phosphatase [Caulobacteraceae bacterium]|nr:trehalose-phosphatase [Caulobacteraceae bacterium]